MLKQKRKTRKTVRRKKKRKKSDERIPKLFGAFFVLLGLYLLIAFVSYIFTWQTDQDKVLQFSWSLLGQSELSMENWLGRLGALVSNAFFYWGFGIPSFLFVILFFRFGFSLLKRVTLKPFWSSLKYYAIGIVFFSMILEFIFGRSEFPFGGSFGESTTFWFSNFLGNVGLALFLLFALAGMIIWLFNPSFQTETSWLSKVKMPSVNWKEMFSGFTSTPKIVTEEESNTIEFEETGEPLKPTFLEQFRADQLFPKKKPVEETKSETPQTDTQKPAQQEPQRAVSEGDQMEFKLPAQNTSQKKKPIEPTELEIKATQDVKITEGNPPPPKENTSHIPKLIVEEENPLHSEPYDPKLDLASFTDPGIELLKDYSDEKVQIDRAELEANKDQIIETLLNYKIEIIKIRATIGPTVTLYEIVPAPGVRISKIKNLEDDIALSLAALGIRIIAPIPGKGTIGIEVPNKNQQIVSIREVLKSSKFSQAKMDLPIALGKTISNEVFVADLAKMPHLLIAGATGQGKSVGINTVIMSLLYKKHPSQIKFVMIDPKKVELFPYSKLEKHYLAFLPDQVEPIVTETKKVIYTLNSLCIEMDQRYDLLKKARARNIREYNEKFTNRKLNPRKGHRFLPFIVLVIDEFADLIMTAGKEVELPIGRLAQLARAVGIHLIIATQRPSVNIITGVIKANFPARLAFKVTSKVDSRTILDIGGAEQLIGRGDMLLSIGSNMIRLQCAFVDTPEVESVTNHIGGQQGYPEPFYLPEYVGDDEPINGADGLTYADLDDFFEDAARLVVQNQSGSTSMIQRRMKLGYNRAGRIMDQLEALGIVGPSEGSKAREVLVFSEIELQNFLDQFKNRN